MTGKYVQGAESSGDIDLLLTHPDYTSLNSDTSKNKRDSKKVRSFELLKAVVDVLEKDKFVTDTLAFGNTKFMVCEKYCCFF